VFALILESLGSTELLFILAIALIFFGPRKLPQLARSMGKGLAEFRRASDDFKRTWEREVAFETTTADDSALLESDQSFSYSTTPTNGETAVESGEPDAEPDTELIEPDTELITADPEPVVPRETAVEAASGALPEVQEIPAEPVQPEPVRKQDWL
jgi:TatA/E family protein of Tat protein translocase